MKVCWPNIRNIIEIKSQMTPGFQQKPITKREKVFKMRTRQLNISFQWFEVFLGFAMVWFGSSPAEKLFSFKKSALCNIFFAEIMWSLMTSYMTQTLNGCIILVDLIFTRFL